jgi:hypothetical protein
LLCGGNKCIDGRNDANNCKTCGNKCSSGSCRNNYCCQANVGTVYFQDDFSDNSKGWTLDPTWEIGPGKASVGCFLGNDPATDHTGNGDNGYAGVLIGQCQGTMPNPNFRYMTSPSFDTSAANKVVLSFWRHLHCDDSLSNNARVEVYDGTTWQVVYQNFGPVNDSVWTHVMYDVTQYKNSKMQVRIGYNITFPSPGLSFAGWNIDDVLVAEDDCAP